MDTHRNDRTLHPTLSRTGRLAVVLVALALLGAVSATSGAAARQSRQWSSQNCTPPPASGQPFKAWNDQGSYFLAPAGNFESSNAFASWSTSGTVSRVTGNEPWHVGSSSDGSSLSIGAGASATTPPICVTIHTPNIRFFLRNTGSSTGRLSVRLTYTGKYGDIRTTQVASLAAGSSWSLSPQILFINLIAPSVGGQGQTSVKFTFSASGATWGIDDFYVDPLKSH